MHLKEIVSRAVLVSANAQNLYDHGNKGLAAAALFNLAALIKISITGGDMFASYTEQQPEKPTPTKRRLS